MNVLDNGPEKRYTCLMSTIYSKLPRHNADTFAPRLWDAAIERIGTEHTPDEIRTAIADTQRSIDRNDNVEFDDTRSRHIAGKMLKVLRAALVRSER